MQGLPYWRLASLYFCYFTTVGVILPYWGPYLNQIGYDPATIGLLSAIPLATKIVAPNLWGWWADRSGNLLFSIQVGCLLAAVGFAAVIASSEFVYLCLSLVFFSFFWNAVMPQFEVITLRYLGDNASRYSQIRIWGSIGFIVTVVVLGGYFERYTFVYLPWLLLFFLVLVMVASLFMPRLPNRGEGQSLDIEPQQVAAVFFNPSIIVFFIAIFLLQISHGAYYGFYSLFMAEHGYSATVIGFLWAVGVVAEIMLFFRCHAILQRFSLRHCFLVSIAIAIVRWLLIGYFPEYVAVAVFSQVLHAFTFGMVHAVSMEIIRKHFGWRLQGQGQALYSAFSLGAGTALGTFLAGLIWTTEPVMVFIFASLASFLAGIIAYFYVAKDRCIWSG